MLKLAYISLATAITIILCFFAYHAIRATSDKPKLQRRRMLQVVLGLLAWHLYLFGIGSSDFLTDLGFPPRFAIFTIFPLFIFTAFFLYFHRKKRWISSIPYKWLIIYQSFRVLIESLFVFTVAAGLLHKNVTIEGYNYDMVFGASAILVFYIALKSKEIPRTLLKIWNYLGLIVISIIIILFQLTIYTPEIFGPDTSPFPSDFGRYPYVLVPGFLMPSAVFIHVLSLVQLAQVRKMD